MEILLILMKVIAITAYLVTAKGKVKNKTRNEAGNAKVQHPAEFMLRW